MPGTPIRGESGCQAPPVSARSPRNAGFEHPPGTRNLVVLATRSKPAPSTPQSASKAIDHSYLSESRGGPGPTWLFEGGWAGGGGGELEADGLPSHECSPPARQRRAALEDGGTDERLRSEGTLSENAWPRSKIVAGGRTQRRVWVLPYAAWRIVPFAWAYPSF